MTAIVRKNACSCRVIASQIKKVSGSVVTYYVSPAYEVTAPSGLPTVTTYIYLNACPEPVEGASGTQGGCHRKRGTTLTYLHGDHLGSTVLETNTSGTATADQQYFAGACPEPGAPGERRGKQRDTGPVVTEHKFTGQKLDGTGLQYYNAITRPGQNLIWDVQNSSPCAAGTPRWVKK